MGVAFLGGCPLAAEVRRVRAIYHLPSDKVLVVLPSEQLVVLLSLPTVSLGCPWAKEALPQGSPLPCSEA